ncbi:MAG: hypothetical protein UR63_C0053G0004 [Candidatus Roizmanbacteria bacterium GW2011_GWC2_35_12]|uniref:Glycosyltransferase RgtA/B/C/D-like domain-containing protein n=1 Tax=Candidatus Roizmanbacteria bacterium GW2011_GWC2_35_12 TaxID=1618485 RepID=A0A0G0BPA1_9BACT|nr:MAG: hypothetical protein UR63_C0053G0004 [Candidatus Roizmanbacteria bacterium GW2011_GWC2_35_12]
MNKFFGFIKKHKFILLFLLIVLVGMYLRFYRIESVQSFGWDQGRDAWKTRDIIKGQIVLNGPRTGVGHFHLGSIWYYMLVPFYLLTNLDPVGAIYLNIIVNLFNFAAILFVTKKIYGEKAALFVIFIYATNKYLIEINRTAWNVSPIPGVAALIFYSIYKIVYESKYKWIFVLSFLTGFFFHLHFSVVFLPLIILASFILAKDKKKVFVYGLISLPLLLIWLIPSVIYDLQSKNTNTILFNNFLKDYFIDGFHLRFFLYRIHDAFIQLQMILSLPKTYSFIKFIIPGIFLVTLIFEQVKKQKILGYLIFLWFVVPAFGYSFYGGTTSEYYMLMNSLLIVYIVYYLQNKLFKLKFKPTIYLLIVFWSIFTYYQTKDLWIKNQNNGLIRQKEEVRENIRLNNKISFNEGDIKSYLWQIWVEDKK